MQSMRSRTVFVALAAALIPPSLWASCDPATSIGGQWNLLMKTASKYPMTDCTMNLLPDGTLNVGRCRIRDKLGAVVLSAPLGNGKLAVTDLCAVSGTLTMVGGLFGGASGNHRIRVVLARLSPVAGTAHGFAVDFYGSTDPQSGTIDMVRY